LEEDSVSAEAGAEDEAEVLEEAFADGVGLIHLHIPMHTHQLTLIL
jgi:hypothetical protein